MTQDCAQRDLDENSIEPARWVCQPPEEGIEALLLEQIGRGASAYVIAMHTLKKYSYISDSRL
jgi:hypothetical protein